MVIRISDKSSDYRFPEPTASPEHLDRKPKPTAIHYWTRNPHRPDVPLNHSTFCSWQFGRYPMPLAAVPQPGTRPLVHIDARCVYPEDPNPWTGVYAGPKQISSQQATQIPNGTEVALICYAEGRKIRDAVGNTSSIWVEIGLSTGAAGYIPDVNIGGGYTRQQLSGLGLSLDPPRE